MKKLRSAEATLIGGPADGRKMAVGLPPLPEIYVPLNADPMPFPLPVPDDPETELSVRRTRYVLIDEWPLRYMWEPDWKETRWSRR